MLVYLLPYIEQENIWRQMRTMTDTTYVGAWWQTNPDWTLAHTQIKILQCPSDEPPNIALTQGSAALFHSFDSGPPRGAEGVVMYFFPGNTRLGKTNYCGVAGPGWAHGSIAAPASLGANYEPYTGIFTNRSETKLQTIYDGTAFTLMFGESLGTNSPGQRDFQWTWAGSGAMATFRGLCNGPQGSATAANWAGFSSRHTGIVQFCFGDGSVRGLRHGGSCSRNPATGATGTPNPDWWAFQRLAGKADGEVDANGLQN